MAAENTNTYRPIKVRETEILSTDTHQQYREKIARITLDSMVQFVGLLDAEGTVLEINSVALEGVGVKLSDVAGRPFWKTFWWQVTPEINTLLKESIAVAAKGEFVRWDTSIYGRASGKETIIIDASLSPVMDENGTVVFICAEGRDITAKKAQEAEIAQKNIELQGLLTRISELDEIKTQFFANVSHELRTPLALIIGPAERLMNPDMVSSPQLQQDTAKTIVRNAKMLLKHVNDLLDISRFEAGKLKIELQETDVAELVGYVASHFDILANERGISFHITTGDAFFSAVDPGKLQRVLMNLLSNAFKFVPNGGTVQCKLKTSGKDLVLSVEDSGPGIKPELRKVIFERFRQGDGATNRQFAGTGLGLAIAQEFVALHKGTIEVLDTELGGAMFQVKIPVTQVSGEQIASPELKIDHSTLDGLIEELRQPVSTVTADQPLQTNKDIVLVVEDNLEMNKFIAQSLEHEYEVVSAFDGEEGLQKALIFHPALIVTDIMMPRVSGAQMIAELRKRPEMAETPIVLLTAKADEELKLQLLQESAQDFITKPFSERDLQVRIRNLIAVRRSREIIREAETAKRHEVEAINRDLQSRYKNISELFERTPSFMAVVRGPHHVFELANEAYYKLIGRTDVIGKPVIEALPEVKGQGFIEMLDNVISTGKPFIGNAVPIMLQRGPDVIDQQRYVDFVYQPLLDDNKEIAGVFVEGHDVTEQVVAQKKLLENEERLEQQVEDRTRDLHELNQSLKLSNEDLQQFAHVASHDLKEPIRKIKMFSNRLSDEYHQMLPEKANGFLQKILSATDRIYSMVDGVLSYSIMASEAQPTEMVDLNGLLKNIEADLEILIHEKNATLILEPLPTVEGAPVLLYQLFYNLVNNSLKFAKTTEPTVISIKHSIVQVEGNTFSKIVLNDNGIGFDQEHAEKIFKTFTRLNSKDKYEGTGLGLALCKKIVQRHGGSVSAHGEKNKGAAFTVLLPLN